MAYAQIVFFVKVVVGIFSSLASEVLLILDSCFEKYC